MKLKHSVATMILAVGLMTGAAHAKPIPDGGVTVTDIADVMKAKGYKAEVTTDNSGDPMIKSAGSGVKFTSTAATAASGARPSSFQPDLISTRAWLSRRSMSGTTPSASDAVPWTTKWTPISDMISM